MAKKIYDHVGECPVFIEGHGWVKPGLKGLVLESGFEKEAYFVKIGAIKVVGDADADVPLAPPSPERGLTAPRSVDWKTVTPEVAEQEALDLAEAKAARAATAKG